MSYIGPDARVYGDAWVSDNARVYGNARVCGNAWVSDNAKVFGSAMVFDNARVFGSAEVFGNAWVYGDAVVSGNSRVYGNARVTTGYVAKGAYVSEPHHVQTYRDADSVLWTVYRRREKKPRIMRADQTAKYSEAPAIVRALAAEVAASADIELADEIAWSMALEGRRLTGRAYDKLLEEIAAERHKKAGGMSNDV